MADIIRAPAESARTLAMTRYQANLLLLLAGAIWGMAFVAQKSAMDSVGPFVFIATRFAVATLVVLPFVLREHRQTQRSRAAPLSLRQFGAFCLIGVSLFAGMAFQQVGLLTTTVSNSGFLTGLYVVFTPLLAIVMFREWPHVLVWPAVVIAFTGTFLLSGGNFAQLTSGDFLTIGSAVCWAMQVVLIARYVADSGRPLALSATQFAVTALLAALVAVWREPWVVTQLVAALPEILYAGIMGSGVAFTLQVIGQRYTTAPQAAIFLSSEAPFAALFGVLFRGEVLSSLALMGCALILAAMLLTELGPMWRRRPGIGYKVP